MSLANTDGSADKIGVWSKVTLSGEWAVKDQEGLNGDYFTIAIPSGLEGVGGSFELDGKGANAGISFGTCTVSLTNMRCVLNANVQNKNNVGGSFNLNLTVNDEHQSDSYTFKVNGAIDVSVKLPNDQSGVEFGDVPDDLDITKFGYLIGDPLDGLTWRIRMPGNKLTGTTIQIDDVFAQQGSTFTIERDSVQLLEVLRTPKCFNKDSLSECRQVLGAAKFNIDDDNDRITMNYDHGQPFDADKIYIFEFDVRVQGDILVGARFDNSATVNGVSYDAYAVRESSGSGTGSGDYVGNIQLVKNVTDQSQSVPADAVYQVTYSYHYKGTEHTGTLNLKADGKRVPLNNIPGGVTVTLTEVIPAVAGLAYKDPVFAGNGVVDGGAAAPTAQVTITGTDSVEVSLTNTAVKLVAPKPSPVPGACAPGATQPSEPTITHEEVVGLTQNYTAQRNGQEYVFEGTATAQPGYQLAADLGAGWTRVSDTEATYRTTVPVADCAPVKVVPVAPQVQSQPCPVGTYEPLAPVVTLGVTEGLVYSVSKQPVLEGDHFVFEVTAVPASAAFVVDGAALGAGWTLGADGVATYQGRVAAEKCATVVAPVDPVVSAGVCPADSLTPSEPTIVAADSPEGIEYSELEFVVAGDKVTFTARALAKVGFQLPAALSGDWTRVSATEATYSKTVDAPVCQPTGVALVTPKITPSVCKPGSSTPTTPVVELPSVPGLNYEAPVIKVANKQVSITVVAKPSDDVFVIDADKLPAGWQVNQDGSATFTYRAAEPDCSVKVKPSLPKTGN